MTRRVDWWVLLFVALAMVAVCRGLVVSLPPP
jgi:hypothetical protein